jgi:hypothetical protein
MAVQIQDQGAWDYEQLVQLAEECYATVVSQTLASTGKAAPAD